MALGYSGHRRSLVGLGATGAQRRQRLLSELALISFLLACARCGEGKPTLHAPQGCVERASERKQRGQDMPAFTE
jgi:hypothetical protein